MSSIGHTLTGSVIDRATRKPIAGAFVHAAGELTTVRTNSDGVFALTNTPCDVVGIVAAAEGYDFTWLTWEGQTENIELQLCVEDSTSVPHSDYPRPDSDRRDGTEQQWLSLNGTWSFNIDPSEIGEQTGWFKDEHQWQHAIRVPFSYCSLAGVGEESRASNVFYASQFADVRGWVWYRREFTVPQDWPTERGVWLRFAAASWDTTVWLNGVQVGQHDDGYTPFDIYLNRLKPGSQHVLITRVVVPDNSRNSPYPLGKQIEWYTNSGGIWQSVWLEPGDQARLEQVLVTPQLQWHAEQDHNPSSAHFNIKVKSSTDGQLELILRDFNGKEVTRKETATTAKAAEVAFDVPEPMLWDINSPNLYTVEASLRSETDGTDSLKAYAGLRSLERRWAPGHSPEKQPNPLEQYQYLYLNNRPIYLRAVLDQAFNPWGICSYTGLYVGADLRTGNEEDPGKGSILFDLHQAKQLGFNCVRMHIKINDPRWYHWADQLGILVWYDQPNFGYDSYDEQARELWQRLLLRSIARDYNHASVVIWNAFNEGWGLDGGLRPVRPDAHDWVRDMTSLTKNLMGQGRLVVDNSPCEANGHLDTDILDWHNYYSTWEEWQRAVTSLVDRTYPGSTTLMEANEVQVGQPLINGEFGPWSGGREKDQNVSAPFDWITELFRAQPKLNGYLFTELADIEWEWNGFLAYDRTLQLSGYADADNNPLGVDTINADNVLIIQGPPLYTAPPGSELTVEVSVSWFSGGAPEKAVLRWRFSGTDEIGLPIETPEWAEREVAFSSYTVTELGAVSCRLPIALHRGRLDVELHTDGSTPLRRWTPVVVHARAAQVQVSPSMALLPLPLRTGSTVDFSSGGGIATTRNRKVAAYGHGDGSLAIELDVPKHLTEQLLQFDRAQLVLEASACRPGIPRTRWPQTSERRYPTVIRASVNGTCSEEFILPDAQADSRGATDEGVDGPHASYGFRVVIDLDIEATKRALADDKLSIGLHASGGGLIVFGANTGQFGINPHLVLTTQDAALSVGVQQFPAEKTNSQGAGVSVHLEPGHTISIVTAVNDTPKPIHQIRTELRKSNGECIHPISESTVDVLQPGQAWHVRYKTDGHNYELRSRAYWTQDDRRQVTEQPSIKHLRGLGEQASLP